MDTTQTDLGRRENQCQRCKRNAFRSKVLQQNYSYKFRDYALEFYSFVADNYAPFYSVPIECNERDAAYVLDGILYNESDLELEEHYTDTHGYTEINFAAFGQSLAKSAPNALVRTCGTLLRALSSGSARRASRFLRPLLIAASRMFPQVAATLGQKLHRKDGSDARHYWAQAKVWNIARSLLWGLQITDLK